MRFHSPSARRLLACVLLTTLALAAPALAADAPSAEGRWQGAIELPGSELAVTVDLARGDDGGWQGEVDIPAQGAKDLPLTDVTADGAAVSFRIANVPGEPTFRGTLDDAGATLSGDFTQGGGTYPFTLTRSSDTAAVSERVDPAAALDGFDAWMAGQLEQWKVPGAAVAVIHDGEVVLAEGYGVADRETERPVTADTLFAIGSATKAFTATVVAELVDDGALEWDEPVRTYLPGFELHDDVLSARVTVRDLLSHRTGLPRHDLVWYGADLSREELFERLRHLEPTEDLRARFQYQNLMFMTAGFLSGQVAGTTWEELVRRRIFEPLGMERSNLAIAAMASNADAARGYEEKDADAEDGEETADGKTIEPMPYRDIDAVGPAGSINSSAREMAAWVRLQLAGGAVDGTRVVGAAALGELHRPQIVVSGGLFSALFQQPEMPYLMYGLGWFVQPYRGHEMIHHGGNIDGFSARVTFLPKDGVGVVVLTNLNGNQLPTVATLHVLDRLLGLEPLDWSGRYQAISDQVEGLMEAGEQRADVDRKPGTRPSRELAGYAGTYRHPAYGDAVITLGDDGALALAYHTLESPLEHWHYDVFRATGDDLEGLKIAFHNDLSGNLSHLSVALEQGLDPFEFEKLPPEGLDDPQVLAAYTGDFDLLGQSVRVELRDDALTVTVPGQPTYTLVPVRPDEFEIEGLDGFAVHFLRGDDGAVDELVFIQPQGNVPAKKKEDAEEPAMKDAA